MKERLKEIIKLRFALIEAEERAEKETEMAFTYNPRQIHLHKGIEKIFNEDELWLYGREDEAYPYELRAKLFGVLVFQIFKPNQLIVIGDKWEVAK